MNEANIQTPEPFTVRYFIHSKTGRDISSFSSLRENAILFAPGTQFIVCKSGADQETGTMVVYLREISIGTHA